MAVEYLLKWNLVMVVPSGLPGAHPSYGHLNFSSGNNPVVFCRLPLPPVGDNEPRQDTQPYFHLWCVVSMCMACLNTRKHHYMSVHLYSTCSRRLIREKLSHLWQMGYKNWLINQGLISVIFCKVKNNHEPVQCPPAHSIQVYVKSVSDSKTLPES